MEVIVPDPSKINPTSGMVESKSVGTFSPFQRQDSHRGLFVDRGVGSPRLAKSVSASTFATSLKLDSDSKVSIDFYIFFFLKVFLKKQICCLNVGTCTNIMSIGY